MKKILALCFAAVMCLGLVACGGGNDNRMYADGTYTGVGAGMGGELTVTISIEKDKITVVDITDPGETIGIGGAEAIADGTFTSQINEAQSAQIAGVAGASVTSDAVRQAVTDALAQAAAAK